MNERFEKLVAEAFFDETADASDTKIYKLSDAQMQKFAQLIVAECAELCSDLDGGENMFSRGIRRHFGVEE